MNQPYPFAQEFITDASGQVRKVILDITDYEKLIEALEDEALSRRAASLSQRHRRSPTRNTPISHRSAERTGASVNVEYLPSFPKDLKALKSTPSFAAVKTLSFEEIPVCDTLDEIRNLKKLTPKAIEETN